MAQAVLPILSTISRAWPEYTSEPAPATSSKHRAGLVELASLQVGQPQVPLDLGGIAGIGLVGAYGLVGSIELVDDTSHVVGVHAVEQAYERLGLAGIARVINAIRGQVVDLLNGGSIRMRDMIDVVNHIRCYPDLFPEWHASGTAKLFSPPIFTNLKTNKGYWF